MILLIFLTSNFLPVNLPMTLLRTMLGLLLVVCVLLAAGCMGQPVLDNHHALQTSPSEGENSTIIHLASENVSPGDLAGFSLSNETSLQSRCPNYLPSYGVEQLTDNGSWAWLPEPRATISVPSNFANPAPQTSVYTFSTTGWEPGRYRVQLDCGAGSKEFLITGNETPSPCIHKENSTPYITIDPIGDRQFGDNLIITGTTNIGDIQKITIVISIPAFPVPYGGTSPPTGVTGGFVNITSSDCNVQKWLFHVNGSLEQAAGVPYFVHIKSENGAVKNDSFFNVYYMKEFANAPRPSDNYLTFPATRGETFSYHGFAPDPSPSTILSANNTPGTGSGTDAAISEVHVWLFGNKYANMTVMSVNPDKSFTVTLTRYQTAGLASGPYRMLFQYPGMKNQFDIQIKNGTYTVVNANGDEFLTYYDIPDSKITGFKVMDMLEQELKKPNSHDKYSIISIAVGDSPNQVTAP